MMGLHHKLGDPPTEPLSLQRQIDTIKADVQKAVDALNERVDDLCDHRLFDELKGRVLRIAENAATRSVETEHIKKQIQGVEDSLDLIEKRVNVISSAVTQHVASGIKDEKHLDSLEKKIDGLCEENAQLWTNAYNLEDETGDHLRDLEKKIDACRVAVHNVDRITYEHTLRLHGLDEIVKDHAIDQLLLDALEKRVSRLDRPFEGLEIEYGTTRPDPWKERWDALKKRFAPTRADELEERLTYRYLQRVMAEMEEA